MGHSRIDFFILTWKVMGNRPLGKLDVDVKTVLKLIFKKLN